MRLMLSWMWAACVAPESEPGSMAVGTVSPPAAPLTPGVVEGVDIAADLTGDGEQDVLVHSSHPAMSFLVPGPLARIGAIDVAALSVAVIVHPTNRSVAGLVVADVDGDGVSDVVSGGRVLYGPLGPADEGVGLYDAEGAQWYHGEPIDLDGDGVMERVVATRQGTVELFAASREPEAPFAVLESTCADGGEPLVRVFPDLDGDGVRELLWIGQPAVACRPRWLSADVRGTVQVEEHPRAIDDVDVVLGDITGDGAPEVMMQDDSVRAGPFDLSQPNIGGTAIAFLGHQDVPVLNPLPFDLDGDGRPELEYYLSQASPSVRSIVSWPQGLDAPLLVLPRADERRGRPAAYTVERGRAILAELAGVDDLGVRLIDLGPVGP